MSAGYRTGYPAGTQTNSSWSVSLLRCEFDSDPGLTLFLEIKPNCLINIQKCSVTTLVACALSLVLSMIARFGFALLSLIAGEIGSEHGTTCRPQFV